MSKVIFSALIAAKKDLDPLYKTSLNPHFKNKYVDLAGVVEAVADGLAKNGLAVIQLTRLASDERSPILVTRLIHESGEYIEGEYPLLTKDNLDPQKLGAAITYARRYSLMAILGLAPEDDDGNTASDQGSGPAKSTATRAKSPAASGTGPTPAQKRLISKLVEDKMGIKDKADFEAAVKDIIKKDLASMNSRDASTIIDRLKDKPDFLVANEDEPGY